MFVTGDSSCLINVLHLTYCSVHLIFAILDGIRNSYLELYPQWLFAVFPYVHYPLYRWAISKDISKLYENIYIDLQNLTLLLNLLGN